MGKHGIQPTVTRYLTESRPEHPLAHADGRVRIHRAVLYDAIGAGPHSCHWCGRRIDWFEGTPIHADHVDGDRWNNRADNLVASCPTCNKTRRPELSPIPGGACRNGHVFTPENTYLRPDGGGRQCRTCIRQRTIRRRKKGRAAA